MKIKESNKCDNCAEIETLDHLFFRCIKLKDFLKAVGQMLLEIDAEPKIMAIIIILFLFAGTSRCSEWALALLEVSFIGPS